jgi:hypothetical protein
MTKTMKVGNCMNNLEDILGLRESDWPDEFKKLRDLVKECSPEEKDGDYPLTTRR